jgi:hypothetical protein
MKLSEAYTGGFIYKIEKESGAMHRTSLTTTLLHSSNTDVRLSLYNLHAPVGRSEQLDILQISIHITVKVHLSDNSPIGKVALAAYFHTAHYNSPMALAAYFCRYPASRGISRAVPKVSVCH